MTRNLVPMALIVGLMEAANDAESIAALLEELVASGRISDEQANVINAQVQSGDHTALDQLWMHSYEEEGGAGPRFEEGVGRGISYEGYGRRMGDIFGVDGQRVAHGIGRAHAGAYPAGRETGNHGGGKDEEATEGPCRRRAEFLNVS